jgi:O-antigen biosynthesis protein
MLVYASIYGGYDAPKPPIPHPAIAEWRLYTDSADIDAPGWHVIVEPREGSPRMAAKFRKCHPPDDVDRSLYLDGSIRLRSPELVLAAARALDLGGEWAMYAHPDRSNILAEADASARMAKYAKERVRQQAAHYLSDRPWTKSLPLWAAGILARQHTRRVITASAAWFEECVRWTPQDQISLPVVLDRHSITPTALTAGGSLWTNTLFAVELAGHADAGERGERGEREERARPVVRAACDRPAISVITPLHAPCNAFVDAAYRSLAAQSRGGWEWIVVENRGGKLSERAREDPRVRVVATDKRGIGALKRFACDLAAAPVVVELDADDLLAPDALARVAQAFEGSPGVDFVYSDFAEFVDGTWDRPARYPFAASAGWGYYPVEFDGHPLVAMRAPEVTAHNLRFVDWAPNHLRAWRAAAYWSAGGHDANMEVGDDHELMCRMFLRGARFERVPACLYYYRVHAANTVGTDNAKVRAATTDVYNRCIWALAEKWARDRKLLRIDLCGAIGCPPGYTPIDRVEAAAGGPGIVCDLESAWKLDTSSVGLLRAADAVEHLRDPIHTMNEAYRVLAPGGFLMIDVPSTNGLGAFCDPTHRSFWNRLSFRYYSEAAYRRFVPEFRGCFQVSRVLERFPTGWHKDNNVPYVEAHLFCAKDGFRAMGHADQ